MRGIHLKGMSGKSNVITKLRQKYYHCLTTATSNVRAFKEFLRPLPILPNSTDMLWLFQELNCRNMYVTQT
jgi:hypothetical protein